MALVTLKELLQDARKRKYAVGGYNVFNFETLGAVIEVAEELKTPLVIGIPERLFKFVDVDTLSAAMVRAALKSPMPIALHLDHGYTYEGMMKAIRWGFTSIMFDGSSLCFEENLKRTKDITRIAHSLGISVEGELGYVGCYGATKDINEENLVKPETALDFVEKTKIDALAIAVGTNHGAYHGSPKLNFSRLAELNNKVSVPLVLHGGSKLSKDDYQNSIRSGIAKINIATDTSLVAGETLKNELAQNQTANYVHLMSIVKKGVKNSIRKYMLSFDCISKAM
ncbi:MAG TPA: class II fructose-bisphosphate aldolase [Methylomusa anaerophila]|uniref:Putative fructose-bisphosphate aldolase n=1 Tax=Methylomusa anaerophila TaxID=1930071 RepID=A0A348AP37_9FIRM|nr:class II fructose-bisphosphate aldolase [Methylomusa anaerophila]BBB92835.1 putative fructose-bisphosphate aldolase [Methylomusa anaerophila]HML87325.1 class II fructose-bisphosphate aldolase [Methylomusa anaerophila]